MIMSEWTYRDCPHHHDMCDTERECRKGGKQ